MLKVFLPQSYIDCEMSGFLYGTYNEKQGVYYVHSISKCMKTKKQIDTMNEKATSTTNLCIFNVGFLAQRNKGYAGFIMTKNKFVIKRKNENFKLQIKKVNISWCIILYNNNFLHLNSYKVNWHSKNNDNLSYSFSHIEDNKCCDLNFQNFQKELTCLHKCLPEISFVINLEQQKKKLLPNTLAQKNYQLKKILYLVLVYILNVFEVILSEFYKLLCLFLFPLNFLQSLFNKLCRASSTCKNMSEKISLLSKVKPSGVKNLNTLTSEGDVLSKNIVFSLIADTAVGLFFCCMVFYLDLYDLSYAGKRLIPHLEEIAKQVNSFCC